MTSDEESTALDYEFPQDFFELAPTGMAILDPDGGFLRANSALCDTLGYGKTELSGKSFFDLIDAEDVAAFREALRHVLQGRTSDLRIVQRYAHKDACATRGLTSVKPVRDEQGKPKYLIAQITDLSQFLQKNGAPCEALPLLQAEAEQPPRDAAGGRKRPDGQGARCLALLTFALNQVREAAFLIDEQASFHYVNDEACRSLGYSSDELLGMRVQDIDPDWPQERFQEGWKQTREQGTLIVESRHRTKDGQVFPVEITANYFEYEGLGYNLALARDIAERRRAETALRESEQRYREIFDNALDALFLLEVTEDGRFRNIEVTPAFEQSVGMSRAELVGKFIEESVPEETAQAVIAKYRRCVASGAAIDEEVELDLPSGRRIYHSTLIPVRDGATGRFHRIVGITRDITLRKQHERVLQERVALEHRLTRLTANAPGFMYTCRLRADNSFHFPYASPGIEGIYGIQPEDVADDVIALDTALHPDDAARVYETTLASARSLSPFHCEFRIAHPKKGEIWVEARSTPECEADGSILWHGFMHDITERKRMDVLLHAREQAFRALVENSPDYIVRYDTECRRLYVNPALERLFGLPAERVLGKTPMAPAVLPEADFYMQKVRKVLDSGREVMGEIPFHTPTGEARWGHLRMVPEFGPDGRIASVLAIGRDLSAQKTTERQLHTLLENIPDFIVRFDADCRFSYVNPAIAKAFAVPAEHLIGKTLLDPSLKSGGKDLDRVHECIRRTFAEGTPNAIEATWSMSGGARCFEIRHFPEKDDAGRVASVLGIARDITERKRMQAEAESNRLWLRTLIQSNPDPVWVKSPKGVFLACNAAFGRLYNTDESGILGKTDFDFVEPELAHFFQQQDKASMALGHSRTNEEWVTYLGDGRQALWETVKTPLYDAAGQVTGVLGVARDITEHKRLESALRAKDEYQRALLDNFPFMVWLKDTESRFLAVNQPFAETAGRESCDSFLGKTDLDFFPPDLAERYRADDREVLRLKQKKTVEELIKDKGIRKWFETYKAPVEIDGKLLGTVGFARDITARKRMEAQLLASELQFRTLAENSPNIIIRYDRDCLRTYVNPAYEREVGIPAEQALHAPLDRQWQAYLPVEKYREKLRQVMATGAAEKMLMEWMQPGSALSICHAFQLVPEYDPTGQIQGVLAIGHDITALVRHERLEERRLRILEKLACGAPLAEILHLVVEYVEKAHPEFLGSIMLADADGKHLYSGPAPSLPADYTAAVNGIAIGDGIGSCGTAAWRVESVIVEDVRTHPYWAPYKELALAAGLLACWSEPFCDSSGRLLGTFGIYRRHPGKPSPEDMALVRQASHLAAIAVEHTRANELLRTREWQFRTLAENLPDHIIRFDETGHPLYANPLVCRDFDLPLQQDFGRTLRELSIRRRSGGDEVCAQALKQTFETGLPSTFEATWTTLAGERIFDVRHIPEQDASGRPISVLHIARDITVIKEAEMQLRESHDLLRELAAHRETAREEERKRIAREIHDELGQHLTALRMGISVLRFQFGQGNPPLVERTRGLMTLADKTIQVVREVVSSLRPATLDMGLATALNWLVDEFTRHTGIRCHLRLQEEDVVLDEDRAITVFRVVQESLTNVARHSEATRVEVALERHGNGFRLEIGDNGKGFNPTAPRKNSFGLLSMRERGVMLGGELTVASAPDRGTTIRLNLPLGNNGTGENRTSG